MPFHNLKYRNHLLLVVLKKNKIAKTKKTNGYITTVKDVKKGGGMLRGILSFFLNIFITDIIRFR